MMPQALKIGPLGTLATTMVLGLAFTTELALKLYFSPLSEGVPGELSFGANSCRILYLTESTSSEERNLRFYPS